MTRLNFLFPLAVVLVAAWSLTGCGTSLGTAASTSDAQGGHLVHEGHDHAGHAHGHGAQSAIEKALAQLSAVDRALAEKQKICPVSGEPLGSMGTPVKVNVNGRDVFLCCAGCEDALRDQPETYLAKLPN